MAAIQQGIAAIGIGNEFRQDDGVGAFIVKALDRPALQAVTLYAHHGAGVDLLAFWQSFATVFLFDAVSSGAKPGTVYRIECPPDELPPDGFGCSTHGLSLAACVQLGRVLEQMPEKLIIYGIEGKSFAQGTGLSGEVSHAAGKVIAQASDEMQQVLTHTANLLEGRK